MYIKYIKYRDIFIYTHGGGSQGRLHVHTTGQVVHVHYVYYLVYVYIGTYLLLYGAVMAGNS